jgi:hypothetical protein
MYPFTPLNPNHCTNFFRFFRGIRYDIAYIFFIKYTPIKPDFIFGIEGMRIWLKYFLLFFPIIIPVRYIEKTMGFFLFLTSFCALIILLFGVLKLEKLALWGAIVSVVSSIVITANGTFRTCAAGWKSGSIGRQGACSHHGGVVTRYTEFGWYALSISIAIIAITILIGSMRKNNQ